ncbi:hypothetical protein LCGC14_0280870 [marine sediment metagenome]|uniref:DUF4175 domain-containing protein n=2 Tax=root TaxID=1 RepID=A0A0F9U145_9ZZZZ
MKIMKTLVIILSAIGLLSLNSCNQKTDPTAMLENSETRTELFDAITSNHDYMTEFMGSIQENNHAMQMMQGNKKMMGTMMQDGGMKMMMKDSMMKKNMMQMMHEKGMMSEDCLESCKNMMAEEGLDIIEQGEIELSKSQSHSDHH